MGMRLTLVAVNSDRLPVLSADDEALEALFFEPPVEAALVMDKEWHGIHFLLTGDPWSTESPYAAVILGGEETTFDVGYGPARILSSEQVVDITSKLRHLPLDELRARYNPAEMASAGIYPDVWEREGPDALEWLLAGYVQLRDFYERASTEGKAVVLGIV
jgi:hypothetical protein